MDSIEYGKLVGALDRQLAEEKQKAEEHAKREELVQRIKLRSHWIEGLERRKAELEKLSARPVVDIDSKLDEVHEEKELYERDLEEVERRGADRDLGPEETAEIEALMVEIESTQKEPMHRDERWALCDVWAIRWRVIAAKIGDAGVDRSSSMRRGFAMIREVMEKEPVQGWFIEALNPKSKVVAWKHRLAKAKTRYERLAKEHEQEDVVARTMGQVLEACRKRGEVKDEETLRQLKHSVRDAAKYEHLRAEVAQAAQAFRTDLGEEFTFLWKEAEEPEELAPTQRLSNREIVARILRRMHAKRLIGGCHGPADRVCNGFPAHDFGRAKEALEILVRGGIVKSKPTQIGQRVSIMPTMLKIMDALVAGTKCDFKVIEDWCAQDNGTVEGA